MPFEDEEGEPVKSGLTINELDDVLCAHYLVTRVFVVIPRIEKYAAPFMAVSENVRRLLMIEYGQLASEKIEQEVHVTDSRDDSCMQIFLKLEKRQD
jgi:hypothetical protein